MPPTALAEIEEKLKGLREQFNAKVAENNTIADAMEQDKDGVFQVEAKQAEAFRANSAAMAELRPMIEAFEQQKQAIVWGAQPADAAAAVAAGAAAGGSLVIPKGLGQMFIESDAFKEMREAKLLTMGRPFELKISDLGSYWRGMQRKDVYSDLPTGTPGTFGPIQRDALVPAPQRRPRVRDLFPIQNTNASVIEYFRVTGFTNNASVVPERSGGAFGTKPQSNLDFEGQQAAVRTIAHWEAAHRNVLEDEPQLQGLIENELLYGLRLAEDNQILNGTGTGQDLLGILNTPNVQPYSWSSGPASAVVADNKADALRRAATLAIIALYEPTGVVVNDADWEDIELLKDLNGQYLLAVSIALGGEPRVWRMPVVTTPAITKGTALVGSFGIGAQLYDRQQANIRISEHHANFFVENAVAVLAEERLALACKRPESFVVVTFDHAQTLTP